MKEINIARVLVNKRKEKSLTQDELASYLGVSKAAVSKWETGQSYPDVTFLPQLAAYFNISIDELIDYKPQMTKVDIQKLYRRLASEFASEPFDLVMEDCRKTIKKYYSCFPLLLQVGILIVNHIDLLKDPQKLSAVEEEVKALFARVRMECEDVSLSRQALFMEALCCLVLGDSNTALDLLDGTVVPALPPESILASAYQMAGRVDEAKSVLQVGMFQNIVVLFNFFPAYLMLCVGDPAKFEEVLGRSLIIAETFDLKRLHPSVLVGVYLSAAQGYVTQENQDKALEMLQKYTDVVTGDIYPLCLHGDSFFDCLDGWLDQLDLGSSLPRDEKTIRKSMSDVIVNNPVFISLSMEPRFQRIAEKLQNNYK